MSFNSLPIPTANAQSAAEALLAAIGAARGIQIITATTLTAVRGGRYLIASSGTCNVSDPEGTNTIGDSYELWIGVGAAVQFGGVGTVYQPSRFSIRRECTVAGNPGTWATPLPSLSDILNVGAGSWNGNLVTGPQSFSGQVELTGQSATNPTSAMTRALVDARGGRRVSVTLTANETGNENTETLKTSSTLDIPLEIGTWDVEALIIVNCNSTAAGSRSKLTFSGSASSVAGAFYTADQNGSATSTQYPTTRNTSSPDVLWLASSASHATLRICRIIVTAAGNIQVQFAQRTATAGSSPTLVSGSYIRAIKVS